MAILTHSIFARMSALSDTTRSRLLLLLEEHEMTVGEMCSVLQLPQSTVSRHLKLLSDDGWIVSRAEGTSRRYRMRVERLDDAAQRLWEVVKDQVEGHLHARQDRERLSAVLAERRSRSQQFFSSSAAEWDRLRVELFGWRAELLGLLGLLDDSWVVGDLGCGTGHVSRSIAPFVRTVIAVDESPAMLRVADERLGDIPNVEIREGDLRALPLKEDVLDAAVLFLVLHLQPEPLAVIGEVARVVRPGGRILLVDMMQHDRQEFREQMGHEWLGFAAEPMEQWLTEAGFSAVKYRPLIADPSASGPTLFAASGRKS